MSKTFAEDDIDKPVETAAGETLGTVVAFDAETAYVEPAPGVSDSLTAVLDWDGGGDDDGPVPVGSDAVRRITDDAVVLETELPDGGSEPGELEAVEGAARTRSDDAGGSATDDGTPHEDGTDSGRRSDEDADEG